MKRNILVPFDGSDNALAALRLAITLAKPLQEKVIVLNVQLSFHTAHTKLFFNEQTIRSYQKQLFEEAVAPAKTILDEAKVDYELKLRIGPAKEQICDEAETANDGAGVRMIVMGSRGMNPILGGVLGSVSYAVLNSATCPVTVVPFASLPVKQGIETEHFIPPIPFG